MCCTLSLHTFDVHRQYLLELLRKQRDYTALVAFSAIDPDLAPFEIDIGESYHHQFTHARFCIQ